MFLDMNMGLRIGLCFTIMTLFMIGASLSAMTAAPHIVIGSLLAGAVVLAMLLTVFSVKSVRAAARLTKKRADYRAGEFKKLLSNLENLACGDMRMDGFTAAAPGATGKGSGNEQQVRTNGDSLQKGISSPGMALDLTNNAQPDLRDGDFERYWARFLGFSPDAAGN